MTRSGPPLVAYLRQSRAKERTISIEEQRRDIKRGAGDVSRRRFPPFAPRRPGEAVGRAVAFLSSG